MILFGPHLAQSDGFTVKPNQTFVIRNAEHVISSELPPQVSSFFVCCVTWLLNIFLMVLCVRKGAILTMVTKWNHLVLNMKPEVIRLCEVGSSLNSETVW